MFPSIPAIALFLLTRPLRDVTITFYFSVYILQFLLTRPLRDVTRVTGCR